MPNVTPKVLTERLRELETQGLIDRRCASHGPRHVEYALTLSGLSLQPVLCQLRSWGIRRRDRRGRHPTLGHATAQALPRGGNETSVSCLSNLSSALGTAARTISVQGSATPSELIGQNSQAR